VYLTTHLNSQVTKVGLINGSRGPHDKILFILVRDKLVAQFLSMCVDAGDDK
jgi:hypothetical protein